MSSAGAACAPKRSSRSGRRKISPTKDCKGHFQALERSTIMRGSFFRGRHGQSVRGTNGAKAQSQGQESTRSQEKGAGRRAPQAPRPEGARPAEEAPARKAGGARAQARSPCKGRAGQGCQRRGRRQGGRRQAAEGPDQE